MVTLNLTQADVYVGSLEAAGKPIESLERITHDDRNDRPTGWLDNETVLFNSDRRGSWDVFSQALGTPDAELLVGGPEWDTWARAAGKAGILFWRVPRKPIDPAWALLTRLDAEGSETELLRTRLETPMRDVGRPPPFRSGYRCSTTDPPVCLLAEEGTEEIVFTTFDPTTGERFDDDALRLRTTGVSDWDLSPDGRKIAMSFGETEVVRLVDLPDGTSREIRIEPKGNLQYVKWTPDGTRLIITGMSFGDHGYAMVEVDLRGKARFLHTTVSSWMGQPVISPDGRHIAVVYLSFDSDLYLLEGM